MAGSIETPSPTMTIANAAEQTASSARIAQDELNDLLLKMRADPTRDNSHALAAAAANVSTRTRELQSYLGAMKQAQAGNPNDADLAAAIAKSSDELNAIRSSVAQVNTELAKTTTSQRLTFDGQSLTVGNIDPGSAQPNNKFVGAGSSSLSDDMTKASTAAGQGLQVDQPLDPKLKNSYLYKVIDKAVREMVAKAMGTTPSSTTAQTTLGAGSTPSQQTLSSPSGAGTLTQGTGTPQAPTSSDGSLLPGGTNAPSGSSGSTGSPSGSTVTQPQAGGTPSQPPGAAQPPSVSTMAQVLAQSLTQALAQPPPVSTGSQVAGPKTAQAPTGTRTTPSTSNSKGSSSSRSATIEADMAAQTSTWLNNMFIDALKRSADDAARSEGRKPVNAGKNSNTNTPTTVGTTGVGDGTGGSTGGVGDGSGNNVLSGDGGATTQDVGDGSGGGGATTQGVSGGGGGGATTQGVGGATTQGVGGAQTLASGGATTTGLISDISQGMQSLAGITGGSDNDYLGDPLLGNEDVNTIIQAVLLGVYKDGQKQLREVAGEIAADNKKKKDLRAEKDAFIKANPNASDDDKKAYDDKISDVGDDQQLVQMKLQNLAQAQQELLSMISNLSKNTHDNAMAIIRHIGGG